MPNVNLAPFDAQQAQINRNRQLAAALQQQSVEPLTQPTVPGARISPVEGLAKLAQALAAKYQNSKLDKSQAQLSANQLTDTKSKMLALANALSTPSTDPTAEPDRLKGVQALAEALSSSNPAVAQGGQAMMQNQMIQGREAASTAAQQAQQEDQQRFQSGQAGANREFEAQQNQANRDNQMAIQNLPARPKESQLLSPEEEAQQLRLHPAPVPPTKNIDPLSPEGIAASIKIRTAEAKLKPDTAIDPDQLSAWVQVGKTNPEMLKKLSPKDYSAVVAEIQRTGGIAPAEADVMKTTMAANALDSAKWLKDNFSSGAVGVKGPSQAFGLLSKPIAGTSARDFADKFDTFKNQVVLPNLNMLHGLGRVTDREFQALQSSMTAIDTSMSEGQFKSELNKVIDTLQKMQPTSNASGSAKSPDGVDPAVWGVMTPQERALWGK